MFRTNFGREFHVPKQKSQYQSACGWKLYVAFSSKDAVMARSVVAHFSRAM